jgi:hypothetical protein
MVTDTQGGQEELSDEDGDKGPRDVAQSESADFKVLSCC